MSSANNTKKKTAGLGLLRRNVMTDSEDEHSDVSEAADPWSIEFERYVNTAEVVDEEADIVDWWGVRALLLIYNHSTYHCFPA